MFKRSRIYKIKYINMYMCVCMCVSVCVVFRECYNGSSRVVDCNRKIGKLGNHAYSDRRSRKEAME